MEWTCEGVVLNVRPHGEASVVLEAMTRGHGRHLGLVRGGRSRRQQPVLQPGNSVTLTWFARLDEQLGTFGVELLTSRTAALLAEPAGVHGIAHLCGLMRLLPEREPHEGLFEAMQVIADALPDLTLAAPLIVRLELEILATLGFGLDLSECVATGSVDDLVYVSPKSGRAVSRAAGAPYHDRMLPLPPFLGGAGDWQPGDLLKGFRLTGYFLNQHIYEPRGLEPPAARDALLRLVPGV